MGVALLGVARLRIGTRRGLPKAVLRRNALVGIVTGVSLPAEAVLAEAVLAEAVLGGAVLGGAVLSEAVLCETVLGRGGRLGSRERVRLSLVILGRIGCAGRAGAAGQEPWP